MSQKVEKKLYLIEKEKFYWLFFAALYYTLKSLIIFSENNFLEIFWYKHFENQTSQHNEFLTSWHHVLETQQVSNIHMNTCQKILLPWWIECYI